MIKVMIADDQELIRDSLKIVLEQNGDMQVSALASDGRECLDLIEQDRPDVILMDVRMPEVDGVQATRIIKEKYPEVSIIILTTFDDDEYVFNALKYGASGYMLKGVSVSELSSAIRTVASGGAMINPEVVTKVVKLFSQMAKKGGAASSTVETLGGAANVAHNLALLGCATDIAGFVGEDYHCQICVACFENGQSFSVGPFEVSPFSIPHDTSDPVGFLVRAWPSGAADRPLTYFHCTDVGTPLDSVGLKLAEADVATLESNPDPVLLKTSGRSPSLIQRICGPRGHLSNEQACELVVRFASPHLRVLALAHLSGDCNAPHVAHGAMSDALARMGRSDVALKVLSRNAPVTIL